MNHKTFLRTVGQSRTLVIGLVVAAHLAAVGSLLLLPGCGTPRGGAQPPPVPMMPPATHPGPVVGQPVPLPPPTLRPAPQATPGLAADWTETSVYEVQPGDILSEIARRYGLSVSEISALNNITDPNVIRVGQKLLVPAHAKPLPPTTRPRPAAATVPADGQVYEVQRGDTLSGIAHRHGLTTRALADANQVRDTQVIRIGQKLVIPKGGAPRPATPATPAVPATPAAPAAPTAPVTPTPPTATQPSSTMPAAALAPGAPPRTPVAPPELPALSTSTAITMDPSDVFRYRVVEGDTIEAIARDFSVLRSELMEMNNLREGEALTPGRMLGIPMPSVTAP